jgi:PAS domain S-box-containing protein
MKKHTYPISYFASMLAKTATTLLMLLLLVLPAWSKTIRVGIYQNSPKIFVDKNGKAKGFFVDIMNEIAKREGWKIDYVFGTWNDNLRRLESFEIDILLDVSFSEERQRKFDLNAIFVIDDWIEIFVEKNTAFESVNDIEGKRVAVLSGSIQETFLKKDIKRDFGIEYEVISYPDYPNTIQALLNGYVDVIVASRLFYFSEDFNDRIKPTSIILRPSFVYFGFPKLQSKAIINAIDKHLADLKNDSKSVYYKSFKKWLKPINEPRYTYIHYTIITTSFAIVLLVVMLFIILIRLQVKKRTAELSKRNEDIQEINQKLENLISEYKKTEGELVKFRFMVENARQEAYLVYPNGDIAYVNHSVCNNLGYSREEILSEGIKLFDPNFGTNYQSHFEELKAKELPSFETIHYTKGGRKLYKQVKSFYLKIDNEEFVCGFAEDITEQKKAEKALYESQQLFQTLTMMSPVGIFRTRTDGYTTYVNPKWTQLSGLSLDQAQGDGWLIAVHKDDRERVISQWKQKANLGLQSETEYRFLKPDGSEVWVMGYALPEMDGNEIIGYIGTIIDITDRKQSETLLKQKAQEIKEQSEKYLQLIELATDAFFQGDQNGNFIMVNMAACDLTEYSKDELLGMNIKKFFTDDEINKKPLRYDLLAKGHIVKNERQILTKNGRRVYVEMNSKMMPDGTYQSFFRDITERKNSELLLKQKTEEIEAQNEEYRQLNEELQQAKAKAEESDRLKSAFLANMSHEIRTPMNAICGFSRLLERKNIADEKRSEYVQIINSNSQHLLGIINDIVDFSKIESGLVNNYLTRFNLNTVLENTIQSITPLAKVKGVALNLKKGLPDLRCNIMADEVKFMQIINNLIVNAVKFTDKGEIELSYTLKDEKYLEFRVKDTGIGIPKNSQKLIFERFHQVEGASIESRKGTGLGLPISKGYVELMGGSIWVKSEVEKGSTFYFTIPYIQSNDQPEEQESKSSSSKYDWSNKTILVVEDEETNQFFLSEIISETKATVIIAKDGLEAVNLCKLNSKIDLVLMDIKLPVMDGLEATKKIRVFNRDIPVIAQTAYAFQSDMENVFTAGCNGFISKPIDKDDLFELLAKHIKA